MQRDSTVALKNTISHLAFHVTSSSAPARRPSPFYESPKSETRDELLPSLNSRVTAPQKKRKLDTANEDAAEESSTKKRRPLKRGYANPDIYAHLNALSDNLAANLDIVFCGINPGCMSATKGHHFANPTNHFWKGLHLSGLTPRLLSPSEDATLPALYRIGLTNLVERPSAEQAELSKKEMRLSVPSLKTKINKYRPRIVCFVGKGMWLVVESVFRNQISSTVSDTLKGILKPPSTCSPEPKKSGKPAVTPFSWGLQPYKFVYPSHNELVVKVKEGEDSTDMTGAAGTSAALTGGMGGETLFFVMPCTSGRVVSHQLKEKVELFARLRRDLEALVSNTLHTGAMVAVPLV